MPRESTSAARRGEAAVGCGRPTRVLALLLMMVTACATGASTGSRSATVITAEELDAITVPTVYEAVERLRPQFLRSRGASSVRNPQPMMPVVYVGGVRYGGPESLRQLRTSDVQEIRYLNASDATTRYGTDHTGGAIVVTLR